MRRDACTVLMLGLLLIGAVAGAQEVPGRPMVMRIDYEGLLRVDEETVRRQLRTRERAAFDPELVSADIKQLYTTGAFEDIEVRMHEVDGGVALTYVVRERPAIEQVLVEGNDEVSEEDIRKKITVKPGTILDMRKVERSVQSIREHYVAEGYFLADVDHKLIRKPGNLVDVVFVSHEHTKVKVQRIEFVGNENVSDEDLKGKFVMATKEGSLLGFMTGEGTFSLEALDQDLRRLEFFYGTRGFAETKIDPPVVVLSRDRRFITITITVHEGPKYTVGKVTVEGDLLFPKEELEKALRLKTGDVFNAEYVHLDDVTLSGRYKDEGYAFASVGNAHTLHRDDRVIDFTYVIQKGERAKIGRIDIVGADKTRDWTLRRELRIYEGELFSQIRLRESEARIRRLGFFEKVEITDKPGREPNEVDLVVDVKERQTGALTVGAGISSVENFMFQAQVSKQNFLGRGQNISLQAILSSLRTIFMLSFEEPYLFDTNWTLALEGYNYEMAYTDYNRVATGLDVTVGRRITDDFGLSLGYKIEGVDIQSGQSSITSVPVANLFEKGLISSLTGTVYYDSRDDRMFTTRGNHSSLSLEWAGSQLGSDFDYLKLLANVRQYFPLILGSVLKLSGTYGYVASPGGGEVPLFERFYVGGIYTVRGFERYSLGPTVATGWSRDPGSALDRLTIGGNKELIFNADIEFPIFTPAGIRGVIFFDAGNAFDDDENINILSLRTAVGFGIRWWSPIGPLRFEWGFPLHRYDGEDAYVFEFNIGGF